MDSKLTKMFDKNKTKNERFVNAIDFYWLSRAVYANVLLI